MGRKNNEMKFDTKYIPSLATQTPLREKYIDEKLISFLIVELEANKESKDPNISIIEDNERNREMIELTNATIVGGGVTSRSLPQLMYGLQHPTRLFYKDTMAGINEFLDKYLNNKFTSDDAQLRETLNTNL